jgi:hypothetical protein
MGIDGHLERNFIQIGRENAQYGEDIRVVGARRQEQLRGRRAGNFSFRRKGIRDKCDACVTGVK